MNAFDMEMMPGRAPRSSWRGAAVRSAILAVTVAAMLAAAPARAADPPVTCAAAKQKAASKKLSAKVKCHGTARMKGQDVDAACLAKAEEKFEGAFQKAEAKGGCFTTNDAAAVESFVDGTLASLLTALSPGCDVGSCQACTNCVVAPGEPCEAGAMACFADSDCASLNACLLGCTDPFCRDFCREDWPNGVPLYDSVVECIRGICPVTCGPI